MPARGASLPFPCQSMEHSIKSMSSVTTDHGLAVFIRSQWTDSLPVMLSSQPVVESRLKVSDVLEYAQAIEAAVDCLREHQKAIKPSPSTIDALDTLDHLQWKLERMANEASKMHASVVEHMAEHKPEIMQDYLTAFSKAVGEGEV